MGQAWPLVYAMFVFAARLMVQVGYVKRRYAVDRLGDMRRRLKFQRLRLLPAEVLVGEMAVLRRLVVDRLDQVQLLDDNTRSHVEVVADDSHQLVGGLFGSTVGLDEEGEWLGYTNGVGELDKAAAGEFAVDERFRDPASEVGGAAVDFAVILAAESTTAVRSPAAVGVDDDFAAGQTCVALRTADDEEAGGLDLDEYMLAWAVTRGRFLFCQPT